MKAITEVQVKIMRSLLRKASDRADAREFVLEGPHLLEVAVQKVPSLFKLVAFTAAAESRYIPLVDRSRALGCPVYSLSDKLAERITDTEESQGVFALLKMPEAEADVTGDLAIALDAVQDPGNVGTIIRTAGWFGVKSVLLGEGTADPYAPKVVRSTQGSIFSVGLEPGVDLARRIAKLRFAGWRVLATTLSSRAQPLYNVSFSQRTVLIMGSEAHGIQKGLMPLTDGEIMIPRYGEGESLNVAISTAVILAEAQRQRTAK